MLNLSGIFRILNLFIFLFLFSFVLISIFSFIFLFMNFKAQELCSYRPKFTFVNLHIVYSFDESKFVFLSLKFVILNICDLTICCEVICKIHTFLQRDDLSMQKRLFDMGGFFASVIYSLMSLCRIIRSPNEQNKAFKGKIKIIDLSIFRLVGFVSLILGDFDLFKCVSLY